MKNLIVLAMLFITPLVQAQNPDGRDASVHITPSWLLGNATFNRNISIWYPETMSSPSQTVVNQDNGTLTYPYTFGIDVLLKIPTSSSLSMSIAYSYNQRYEKISEYSHYWSLNGYTHKISLTASIYNLFSVY